MPLVAAGVTLATACASSGNQPPSSRKPSSQVEGNSDPVDAIVRMRVPGLIISRTADGGVALQVSDPPPSIDGDNTPLYLIDDAPFHAGPNGELSGIDPGDIASIKLLKRASAAIYGIRGANGVIVVTTKRASAPKR
jgi:TonB-dependent SusC/RagA subfamily outer membrane receptor